MEPSNSHAYQCSAKEKLLEEINQGYISLSKWVIGLSTGAMVFSAGLIVPEAQPFWKLMLIIGLALLFISMILGVIYVKLRLNYAVHNLNELVDTDEYNIYALAQKGSQYRFNGEMKPIEEIWEIFDTKNIATERAMKKIYKALVILIRCQLCLFFIGIIAVAIFGVFSLGSI